jgi:vesicle transport through interaction with t-SNAREs protein 1
MMSSTFDAYAEEFTTLLQQCSSSSSSSSSDPTTTTTTTEPSMQQQQLLEQCQDLLQQMALEARSVDHIEQKKIYMERYKVYKEQYQSVQQQIDRQALLRFDISNTATTSTLQLRDTLQSNEVTMEHQNSTLQQSLKSMRETEQLATSTLEQLHTQRDTLQNSQQKTQTLQSMTQQGNTIATNLLKPWWRKGT